MAQWDAAQGQAKMAKTMQKHPYLWRSPQKSSNPKRKKFFSIFTARLAESVEGLNSSLPQSPGELGLQSSARKVAHAGLKRLKK